jgi:hypothetical protein
MSKARARLLSKDRSAFVVLHIARTDFIAHQYGTEREQYKDLIRQVDAELKGFFDDVIDPGTTFIVTSDHGNDRYGSHGGSDDIYRRVPLVLLGAGIRPIHDFEMSGRQLPLALAVLLGTRLPGGILQPLPPGFLDLPIGKEAQLALANLRRLDSLAGFLDVGHPEVQAAEAEAQKALDSGDYGGAMHLSEKAARQLMAAVDISSKPDPGMLGWILVLFLAMTAVYLTTITTVSGETLCFGLGCVLLLILASTSSFRLVTLGLLASIELGLVSTAIFGLRERRERLGAMFCLAGAIVILTVSGLRFALGGKFLFHLAAPVGIAASVLVAGAYWLLRTNRIRVPAFPTGAELGIIPLLLLALGILQPLEIVPVLLCAVVVVGMRSNHRSWLETTGAFAALSLFFLITQRFAFGWAGERLLTRYLYAFAAGAILVGFCVIKAGHARRWLVPALLCLLPLWAFGFINVGHLMDGDRMQSVALLLAGAASFSFAWATDSLRVCIVPLGTALLYHLYPGEATFWISLAGHVAALTVISLRWVPCGDHHRAVSALMLSILYLMSPGVDFLSVLLFGSAFFFIGTDNGGGPDDVTVVLIGALVLAYIRYGILDSYGHIGGPPYSLGNLDTHSGFAAMSKDVALWLPVSLVVGKMLCASIMVYSLAFNNSRYRRGETRLVATSFALVTASLLEAALELALSYGANERRLSMSMVQVVFHGGMLVLIACGYACYKLLLIRGSAEGGARDA